ENEIGGAPAVEVRDLTILGPLVDEPGARRRRHRGKGLSIVTELDIEVASVGVLAPASRACVLHDETRQRAGRSQIHLEKQRKVSRAPLVGYAAVHSLLRSLILAARNTSGSGTVKREVHLAIRPVDLELVNPGGRLSAVRGTKDIQADEAGFDRWLDHVRRDPCIPGVLPDAPAPIRPAFLSRLSQPLLHVVRGFSSLDAVHQGRGDHAAPGKPLGAELRIETVPEEDYGRQECQPVDPEGALREEGTAQFDLRNRPRLPKSIREGSRNHDSPPIKYSYNASTFSSAGTTLSILWPSSAIRPSARANCSRSRVITSMPSRSSLILISVMCSSSNSSAATPDASRSRHRTMYWLGCSW